MGERVRSRSHPGLAFMIAHFGAQLGTGLAFRMLPSLQALLPGRASSRAMALAGMIGGITGLLIGRFLDWERPFPGPRWLQWTVAALTVAFLVFVSWGCWSTLALPG